VHQSAVGAADHHQVSDNFTRTPVASTSAPANWYPDPYQPGQLRWFDGYRWTEHASGPQPAGAYPMAGYGGWPSQPPRDRSMEVLLPVNRTAWSIAAGYAGLFSILLVFAPLALILGVIALIDLTHKPDVGGRGRAWFGLIAGAFGTLGLFSLIANH
jgi:Protein of unknown function (DUF2510)